MEGNSLKPVIVKPKGTQGTAGNSADDNMATVVVLKAKKKDAHDTA